MRWLLPLMLALLAACGPQELSGEANYVCEEIGRTIANVSWACGGELSAANQRGRDFVADHQCTLPTDERDTQLLEKGLECPVAMAQIPCALAAQLGDDGDAWVAATPTCAGIVTSGEPGGGS